MGNMQRVIVESPYAGNIDLNEAYGEFCLHDCIVNYGESPYASHLLYTRKNVLRDNVPKERELGIKAGFEWRDVAEKTVFYIDLGITDGMRKGINDCKEKGHPYEERRFDPLLWRNFTEYCRINAIGDPKRMQVVCCGTCESEDDKCGHDLYTEGQK